MGQQVNVRCETGSQKIKGSNLLTFTFTIKRTVLGLAGFGLADFLGEKIRVN
jgi:hypothetical protein